MSTRSASVAQMAVKPNIVVDDRFEISFVASDNRQALKCSAIHSNILFFVSLVNVQYAVGTNNITVEQLVVVMRERTTTLESEQQHQVLLQLTYQRVTMTSILESLAQPLNSYALGRLPCVRRH